MPNDTPIILLTFVAAVVLFYGPWQWVCTDWMRQICFEARDKIFDLAAQGRLDFKSSEYRELRRAIEAEIRFAHHVTVPYLLMVGPAIRLLAPDLVERSKKKDRDLRERIVDKQTKCEMDKILAEMNRKVLYFTLLKSPFLVVIPVLILIPVVMFFAAAKVYLRMAANLASTVIKITSSFSEVEKQIGRPFSLPPASM